MKLKPANDRGFLLGEFEDRNGKKCSIQKSSLATEDCIWLGIDEVELKVLVPGKGWQDVKVPEGTTTSARMHLNREMVLELLPQLHHFARTGELLTNSTPTHIPASLWSHDPRASLDRAGALIEMMPVLK